MMKELLSSKELIRRHVRQCKQQLSQEERDQQSQEILSLLEEHPLFQEARVVLLYASLPDEVQTLSFIERWKNKKQILLPIVVGDELELRCYSGNCSLWQGRYGILEPQAERLFTDYASIDLAIVPGVAFTLSGKRLGRGKGYYDRLFSHPAFSEVYKIGLAFSFQVFPALPMDSYDSPLDEILTLRSAKSTT